MIQAHHITRQRSDVKMLVSLLIIDRARNVIHYRSLLTELWQQDTVAGNSPSLNIKQKASTNPCSFHSALGTVSTCPDGSRLLSLENTFSKSGPALAASPLSQILHLRGGIAAVRIEVEPLTVTSIY